MKQFDITYFHGPFSEFIIRPEVIADVAASGMTLVPLNSPTEVNKRALPVLDRFGLSALVGDPRIDRISSATITIISSAERRTPDPAFRRDHRKPRRIL